jgi:predicted transcriptional regulator
MRYINKKTTQITTNPQTGEIVETLNEETVRAGKQPAFIMVFLKDLGKMENLTRAENTVLWRLFQIIDNQNIISITRGIKDTIADEENLKRGSMNTFIANLKKKKMLVEESKGRYHLNPYLFGRGKWDDISKLRQTVEYDFKSGTKTTKVESK